MLVALIIIIMLAVMVWTFRDEFKDDDNDEDNKSQERNNNKVVVKDIINNNNINIKKDVEEFIHIFSLLIAGATRKNPVFTGTQQIKELQYFLLSEIENLLPSCFIADRDIILNELPIRVLRIGTPKEKLEGYIDEYRRRHRRYILYSRCNKAQQYNQKLVFLHLRLKETEGKEDNIGMSDFFEYMQLTNLTAIMINACKDFTDSYKNYGDN